MSRQIIDEKTGIGDTLRDNYYLPNLALSAEEERPIGIWGCGSPVATFAQGKSTERGGSRDQRRRRYLKEHHCILYYNLLTA